MRSRMRNVAWRFVVAAGAVVVVGARAEAGEYLVDQGHIGAGRVWYDRYCTPCHGRAGAAGSAVYHGSNEAVDLRRYVVRNSGMFPAHAWYAVVEDLDQASPHADVWQRIRREQATLIADAAAARGVVTLIADYVLSVQTK